MSSDNIIFYDLRGKTEECWSPNTYRTRLALNYKKIPYETVWLTYPDIKPTIGKYTQPDADMPTVPVIKHGDKWVYDSWTIIQYLEVTFPDTPRLLLPSIESTFFFYQYYLNMLIPTIAKALMPAVPPMLDERGAEYFHRTREKRFGAPLDVWGKGATVDGLKGPLTPVYLTLKEHGPFIAGKEMSYVDILLCSLFLCFSKTDKKNHLDKILEFYGDDVMMEWYAKVSVYA